MIKKYIWLFGENLGETANNNSFYMWFNCYNIEDNIIKYFVLSKNPRNLKLFNSLPEKARRLICWKNSYQHFKLWYSASMYFVTLSYRDVRPEKFFFKDCNLLTEKPVIYLQHGIIAIKQIGYNGTDYNNNMVRFVYYNKSICSDLVSINGFKEYQLVYGEYMPRHKELVKQYLSDEHKNFRILFFPTWREYFGNNFETKVYLNNLKRIINNVKLNNYLKENNADFTICLHPFFSRDLLIENGISGNETICIKTPEEINVLNEIATSDLCITDYSSIGFDFTLLKKPVILFQPDKESYLSKRKLYCSLEELDEVSVYSVEELVNKIVNKNYTVNSFFRKRLPDRIDLNYILNGVHIVNLYRYFAKLQNNSVVFLGYNFYGVGGTVNATHALAEGLLEKGYLVSLLSIRKHANIQGFVKGLNMRCLISDKSGKKLDFLKKAFNKIVPLRGYFKNDLSSKSIGSYGDFAIKKFLLSNKFHYYVSTRESIHLYLDDARNIPKDNKFYFYHTDATVVNNNFPGVMQEIVKRNIDNAIFVTLNNMNALKEYYGYSNYKRSLVIGNSLASNRCLSLEELELLSETGRTIEIKKGIFLLRITSERKRDLEYLLEFGKYLKNNGVRDITIDVYGDGEYREDFIQGIFKDDLENIIRYKGKVNNPKQVILDHDFVIDFSEKQSFGMSYIEAVLNGKMIFCRHNNGSDEVLKECPECFFDSVQELTNKIHKLDCYDKRRFDRYNSVAKKYSRMVITEKFSAFIENRIGTE